MGCGAAGLVKRRTKRRITAAERRICALAPDAPTLDEAVKQVIAELMQGVACPPTDLEDVARKIGVLEISYESFPGSGELHKKKSGYRIVCSSDQPHSRQRFTVAHELAHVILERTGRNAPRTGSSVERVCDMLAAECLMPTSLFEAGLPTTLALSDVEHLSRVFDTSIPATAIRCTHFRRVCIFGVTGDRVTWGCGGIRRGAVMSLVDEVRDGVRSVMAGKQPEENVYFYDNGYRGGYHRFEWIHMGSDSAVFMLSREKLSAREVTWSTTRQQT